MNLRRTSETAGTSAAETPIAAVSDQHPERKAPMLRLVDEKWAEEFSEALYADSSELYIICPFIKAGALKHIMRSKLGNLKVITRFDLNDFAQGVSDIAALRMLLDVNARVRGVRNLHAKLYIFGTSRAIITSANLTEAALNRNHEFGTVVTGAAQVEKCRDYFDNLWERAGDDLTLEQVEYWDKKVTRYRLQAGLSGKVAGMEDLGADANLPKVPPAQVPQAIAEASQAFVKFQGSSKDRLPASEPTLKEITTRLECGSFRRQDNNERVADVTGLSAILPIGAPDV